MLGKKIDKSFGENVCSDLVLQQFCGDRIRNCKYWLDCTLEGAICRNWQLVVNLQIDGLTWLIKNALHAIGLERF